MISSFNLEKLSSLLKDFYTVTHIRITVFNEHFQELVSYPTNRARFCQLVRTDEKACTRCEDCDKNACKTAAKKRDSYIYQCHAGLKEAITPIYLNNLLIGYLFFGHVFSYPDFDSGWKIIKEKCKCYDLNLDDLKEACHEQPIISEQYILSAANLLNAIASYLCLERMATLRHENLPVQIDNYIHANLGKTLDTKTICEHFQIGKTQLYEIAKESYGIGIAELIRNQRIEKAKSLLLNSSELNINEVAYLCGFHDYNYFITVFKRVIGMSPKRFAKETTPG